MPDTSYLLLATFLQVGLILGPFAANAATPEGIWVTEPRDGVVGIVEVLPCGPQLCGTVLYGIDSQGARVNELSGRAVIRAMRQIGPDQYEGEVIDPRNGRVYLGRLRVGSDGALDLDGCVLGGLFCARSRWRRP